MLWYIYTESTPFRIKKFEKCIQGSEKQVLVHPLFTGHYMKMGAQVSYQFYPSIFSHYKSILDCKKAASPTRMIQARKYPKVHTIVSALTLNA